jgi:hypothetical protein
MQVSEIGVDPPHSRKAIGTLEGAKVAATESYSSREGRAMAKCKNFLAYRKLQKIGLLTEDLTKTELGENSMKRPGKT